jgi:hypothetical protein
MLQPSLEGIVSDEIKLLLATADNEIARTTQLVRELDAAGQPAVENGEKIARDYREAFATLLTTLGRFRSARCRCLRCPRESRETRSRRVLRASFGVG